jgi:hypothetical protein
VKSAVLWYKVFTGTLADMGFELNPYKPCMANCMIEGSQCTISWYVDENKISRVNPDIVTMIIKKIDDVFDKMTVTRGNENDFLGMHVHFTNDNKAVITMKTYIREAIQELGLNINREATTPAKKTVFDMDPASCRLDTNRSDVIHSVVANLLYVATPTQIDILLVGGFL